MNNVNRFTKLCAAFTTIIFHQASSSQTSGYAFNMTVPDVRQPASVSGGSACPVPARQSTAAGSIALRWSTVLGPNPVTVFTQNQSLSTQLTEIEQTISTSLAVWTGVPGTPLTAASLAAIARTSNASACGADGLNSICFDQPDMAFTPGVLAFTRVVTADRIGEQAGSSAVSTQPRQILDADIYFNSGDPSVSFAPRRLPRIPNPTISNPSLPMNWGTSSASAIPPSGMP